MTKRVAILTLHWSNNYGAVLQVYALSTFLKNRGYEVEVINYKMEPSQKRKIFSHPVKFIQKMYSRGLLSPLNLIEKLSEKQQVGVSSITKQKIFDDFRNKHLNIMQEAYKAKELSSNNLDFDAFIVGSDQVWAADFLFTSPTYLLSFVPDDKIKISYAASFGKKSLEQYLKPIFNRYVNRLDYISVREKSGLDIVSDFRDDACQVLDPTLLLDNYDDIVSIPNESEYILVYKLNQEKSLSDYFLSQIESISSMTGYKVIYISPDGSLDLPAGDIRLPSPNELLGLIKNAKIVLTNSFHGLVFSIVFKKPFLGFERDLFEDKQNLRLTGLLGMCGIEENLVKFDTSLDAASLDKLLSIDYDAVDVNLCREKEKSISFLLNSLDKQ